MLRPSVGFVSVGLCVSAISFTAPVPPSRTSDSVIFEYHARPELSERLWAGKGFGHSFEDKLPGGKPRGQA